MPDSAEVCLVYLLVLLELPHGNGKKVELEGDEGEEIAVKSSLGEEDKKGGHSQFDKPRELHF